MAFRKTENHRILELTSLIDIVFLLLIFFLVSFAFSLGGDVSDSQLSAEIKLPETETRLTPIKSDILRNLMFQIVPDTLDGRYTRRVYVLLPAVGDSGVVSRRRALGIAHRDSMFATFETDFFLLDDASFSKLAAAELISTSIARYVKNAIRVSNSKHPMIEVRAESQTEFKIINFIMTQCSKYKEVVPQIAIRMTP